MIMARGDVDSVAEPCKVANGRGVQAGCRKIERAERIYEQNRRTLITDNGQILAA